MITATEVRQIDGSRRITVLDIKGPCEIMVRDIGGVLRKLEVGDIFTVHDQLVIAHPNQQPQAREARP